MQWMTAIFQTMARPLKWWVVVADWEQGICVRLGKSTKLLKPGIHFRIPFLDRIYVQSTRLRVVSVADQSVSTKDNIIVTFSVAISYQICDIKQLYKTVSSVEDVLVFEAVSRASREIFVTRSEDLEPKKLEEIINDGMPEKVHGLESVSVRIVSFCTARCYRLISGSSDLWTNGGLELEDGSGEV